MPDCTALLSATDRFASRIRSLPQSRLQGGASAEGLALARWLAAEAQRLEEPGREPRMMPDEGVFVVGDQIAVAGHDLAAALAARPDRADLLDAAVARIEDAADRYGL